MTKEEIWANVLLEEEENPPPPLSDELIVKLVTLLRGE